MAEDPREQFLRPIMKAVDRGIYDVIDSAGNMAGIRADERQDIGEVAKNFINRQVDAGLIPARERVENGKYGDYFNAINHALLSYRYGESPIMRGLLQGKEYLQQGQEYLSGRDPRTQYIDRMNNEVGFALREQGLTEEEALEAMLGAIYETQSAMREGGPESLIPGRHFYLNAEDY
jgi:hypothetical protein